MNRLDEEMEEIEEELTHRAIIKTTIWVFVIAVFAYVIVFAIFTRGN